MNTQVQAIVNSLTFTLPVNQAEIPSIVVATLSATVSLTTLSADDKEQVVIDVVKYYVSGSNMPINEQNVIMNLVPGIIASINNLPQTEASCGLFWSSVVKWFRTNCSCCCTSSNCCKPT